MKKLVCLVMALMLLVSIVPCMAEGDDWVEVTLSTWRPEYLPYFEDVNNQPKELMDQHIRVVVQYADAVNYMPKLVADLAAGTGADVATMPYGSVFVQSAEYQMDLTDRAVAEWGENWRDMFVDGCFSQIDAFDGTRGIPWGYCGMPIMAYNETYFEEYGLEVPKTYDELIEVCKVFRENGLQPIMNGYNDTAASIMVFNALVGDLDRTGEKLHKAQYTGEYKWTDDIFVEAMTAYKRLFDEGCFCDGFLSNNLYMDSVEPFIQGKAPMLITGTFGINFAVDPTYAEGCPFVPTYSAFPDYNGDGLACPVWASTDVVATISENCKDVDAAWEVVKCLTMGSVAKGMCDSLAAAPLVDYTPQVNAFNPDYDETFQEQMKLMNDIVVSGCIPVGELNYVNPDIENALHVGVGEMVSGQATPEEVLESVENAAAESRERYNIF